MYNKTQQNKFNIHGTVHHSMTSSNNQQDATLMPKHSHSDGTTGGPQKRM